jgi:hypothetical protein
LFSTALQWILETQFQVKMVSHILDDFMFFNQDKNLCLRDLAAFHVLAKDINLPINHDKTVYPSTSAVLHGILVDTMAMQARLPEEKLNKANSLLTALSRRRVVTLLELQELIGTLNFACRVITLGRAFLHRLIDLTVGLRAPHHQRRLTKEARLDIEAWLLFIEHFNGISVIPQPSWTDSEILQLFTDSNLGYAAVFQNMWFQGEWPKDWTVTHGGRNIALLEFVPIVLAIELFAPLLCGQRILLRSDNEALVYIINKQSTSHKEIMQLVRRLVVACMRNNICVWAKHISGVHNVVADRLSRFQNKEAFKAAPDLQLQPQVVPENLLPWTL